MSPLPQAAVAILADVAAIATAPLPTTERAEALLAPLHRVVAFDAAHIALRDPDRQSQPPVVRSGYPDPVRHYLDSAAFVDDLGSFGLPGGHTPMRAIDSPVPLTEHPPWAEYFEPAGFGEAIGVPLHTRDGRYLGVLGMHTQTTKPASEPAIALLGALAPLIAHAVDPMRVITVLASMVADATAGVLLTRAGTVLPLPGAATHRLLAAGSPALVEAYAEQAAGAVHATFLAVDRDHDGESEYWKVTTLACGDQPPHHLAAVVLLAPAGVLHGLTYRELTVLGMLINNWDERRIAATLQIPAQTVLATTEAVRAKLAAPTRDAAILAALTQGLYLPPSAAHACP